MAQGEFEQLFATSLTGIYADDSLRDGFSEFANMILNPRLEAQRRRRDEDDDGEMLPVPRMDVDPDLMDPMYGVQPHMFDPDESVELPEIPRADDSAVAVPDAAMRSLSGVSRSGSDTFLGNRLSDIEQSSTAPPLGMYS